MLRTSWMVGASIAVAAAACGPRYQPEGPADEPAVVPARPATQPRARPPAREVMLGEMCPAAASGRPGVMPVVMRRLSWNDEREDLGEVLERNMARQFSALGWDGRRVGTFSVAGAAESPDGTFAAGSYAGGPACEVRNPSGEPSSIPACEKTLLSCALAIAPLRAPGGAKAPPFEEQPDPVRLEVSGACVADDKLLLDVDDDGRPEAFPVAEFLDPFRAPAEEVSAVDAGSASCEPTFAARAVLPASDPRDWRGLDVIGVLDLDGDGRNELIAAFNYQTRRTWAVYSALSSAGRLDLVGEGVPWPRKTPTPESSPLPTP